MSWAFTTTTAVCPCSLLRSNGDPNASEQPDQGRSNRPGPWSYELGVKVRVDQPLSSAAVRFWKSPGETGTHKMTVWSAVGYEADRGHVHRRIGLRLAAAVAREPAVACDAATTYVDFGERERVLLGDGGGLASQIVSGICGR